jgi:hypothetical protein
VADAVQDYLESGPPPQLRNSARAVQRSANALVERAKGLSKNRFRRSLGSQLRQTV